jgi:TolB protein
VASGQYGEIHVMDANGTNKVKLSNSGANDQYPQWSPDGSKIIFESVRDGNTEIYVMNADGSNPVNLTQDPSVDTSPAWSPY